MKNAEWIGHLVKVSKKDKHIKSGVCVEKTDSYITIRYPGTGNLEFINLDTVERINVESGNRDDKK